MNDEITYTGDNVTAVTVWASQHGGNVLGNPGGGPLQIAGRPDMVLTVAVGDTLVTDLAYLFGVRRP